MSRKFNKLVVLSVVVSMMLSFSMPAAALPNATPAVQTQVTPAQPAVAPQPAIDQQASRHVVSDGSKPVAVDANDNPDLLPKTGPAKVVIELVDEPAAVVYAAAQAAKRSEAAAAVATRAQLARIEAAQQALLPVLNKLGATIIYRTQRAYNGIAAIVDAEKLSELTQQSGVKAVHPLISKSLDNWHSVPLIGASQLWDAAGVYGGLDGTGVRIGIIDSGVDYGHADFGGLATEAAYDANDTTVITDTYNG